MTQAGTLDADVRTACKTLVYTTYMGVSHALQYLNELQVLKVEDGK